VYDVAELRAACGQALGFARYVDAPSAARQCAGVRFVFPKKAEAGARLRRPDSTGATAAAGERRAEDGFPAVTYRFTRRRRARPGCDLQCAAGDSSAVRISVLKSRYA
jgi:hypothetical protein